MKPGDLDQVLVLCISLPEAVERRALMKRALERLPLVSEMVDAIRGGDLDARLAIEQGYRPGLVPGAGELTRNEIACVLSHRKALKRFIESDRRWGVILEDDAELDEAFSDVLRDAIRVAACFDLLKLENRTRKVSGVVGSVGAGYSLHVPARPGLGATGFLYSRSGAQKVLRSLETFSVGYDTHLGRLWRSGVRMLQVWPPVVTERAGMESTIGHERCDGRVGRKAIPRRWDRLISSLGRRVFHTWLFVECRRCLSRVAKRRH